MLIVVVTIIVTIVPIIVAYGSSYCFCACDCACACICVWDAKIITSVPSVLIHMDPKMLHRLLHVADGRLPDGTAYANVEMPPSMQLPRSLQVTRSFTECLQTPLPILDADIEYVRNTIRGNRYRWVRHERIKRDIHKLFQQLRTKFASTWAIVGEYLGTVFFMGNKAMKPLPPQNEVCLNLDEVRIIHPRTSSSSVSPPPPRLSTA